MVGFKMEPHHRFVYFILFTITLNIWKEGKEERISITCSGNSINFSTLGICHFYLFHVALTNLFVLQISDPSHNCLIPGRKKA